MIKQLAACIRQYKKDTILAPVLVIIEVVFEVYIPFLMARLIDLGIDAGDFSYILRTGAQLLALSALSLTLGALAAKAAARAAAGFAANMRQDMYYNIQGFSFSNIDKFTTASLVTRLTTDITNVQNAFMMIIRMAVRAPGMLFFSLIMAFRVSGMLAPVFLLILPILGGGLFYIIHIVHPVFVRVFRTYDKLNRVVQENLRGIRTVKSFVREDFEVGKFNGISRSIFNDFTKAEKIIAFNAPLMQFCMYGCIILISYFGARFISMGDMTTGQLTSFFTYSMQILNSLMMLSFVFVMIVISRESAKRITEVLSEKSDLTNAAEPVYDVPDGSIEFSDVSFSYVGDMNKLCLTGINLSIKSGETVGIIGGTGSGKSSLAQLIPRLYDITSGRLTVGGTDVRNYDIETLRNSVAMVLQKNELFSGTVRENLQWGNEKADDAELMRVCALARADAFINEMNGGMDAYIEQGGTNLSGGQKQRLCIARALLKNPKILILDDSTSAIDTKTDAAIRRAFNEDLPHITKIIIAQRIASIESADKIVVMDNGRILAVGTHAELIENNAVYKEVYASQYGLSNE